MKTKLAFLVLFFISFNLMSQETFYIRINCDSSIICGDSIVLESALVTPVNLNIGLLWGFEDFFEFQIVDKSSNDTVEHHFIIINVSFDTTLFLKPGNYIFQWLGACASCTNPEIEGQISDWRVGENHVECDLKVDSLVNPDSISYSWTPINFDTNRIKIEPNKTTTFKVIAEHSNGNTATDSIQILVNPLTVNTGSDKTIVCGDSIEFDAPVTNYSGQEELEYLWSPVEGLNNPEIAQPKAAITADKTYILTITTPNGCMAIDTLKVTVNPLTASTGNKTISCGETAHLSVNTNLTDTNALSYHWSPEEFLNNANSSNPIAEISEPTAFSVIIETPNGCIDSTNLFVNISSLNYNPQICMVSVDNSNRNMIVWNQLSNLPIDSIFIYKETSQSNVYAKIGSRSNKEISLFIDSLSNAAQNSSRYKISMLDSCGYETSLSNYHKTMHLTINTGIGGAWNLIWDGYQGFNYSTYNIYRGTSDNNLLKIAEQASNTFTFTDLVPPIGTVYYQIEVLIPNACNVNDQKSTSELYGSTRSNIVNSNQIDFIESMSLRNIEISPNPAENKIFINSDFETKNFEISIISLDGKVLFIKKNEEFHSEIDVSSLIAGLYLIRIKNKEEIIYKKIIKR